MKILATADFHGSLEASRRTALEAKNVGADIVVLCGDVTHCGSIGDAKKVLSPLDVIDLPVLFVPGNCDPPSLVGVNIGSLRCIHGRCETYGNIVFIGVGGGVIGPFQTMFEMTEEEVMNVLTLGFKHSQAKRWLILVSHSPPKDTKLDVAYTGEHVGSLSIRQFIQEKKPSIVFCGHVHEARGTDQINDTLLLNPGPAKHGHYALVDLNEKIKVELF